jgi:hypothetical protein
MVAGCIDSGSLNWQWLAWTAGFLILITRLLVDLYTLSWVGFWQGLKSGRAGVAIRRTFFYVFIWRAAVLLGLMTLLGIATQGGIFQSPAGMILATVGYVTLPVISLQYLCQAISEVQDNLRSLAIGYESVPAATLFTALFTRLHRIHRRDSATFDDVCDQVSDDVSEETSRSPK